MFLLCIVLTAVERGGHASGRVHETARASMSLSEIERDSFGRFELGCGATAAAAGGTEANCAGGGNGAGPAVPYDHSCGLHRGSDATSCTVGASCSGAGGPNQTDIELWLMGSGQKQTSAPKPDPELSS